MGDLPKKMQKKISKKMVSLLWVTYPDARWLKCELASLLWVTYPNERWWSHCDGRPTQRKMVSLWWVTYPDGMIKIWIGLIVMGDLPKWKKSGLIIMGDLPR
jgi:hypothetical protein